MREIWEFWAAVLANRGCGLVFVNKEGLIMTINGRATEFLGYGEYDLRCRKLTEVFPETRLAEVLTTGQEVSATLELGGRGVFTEYFPFRGSGEMEGVVILLSEDRSHQRQPLLDLYEKLLDDLPLKLVVVDAAGRVVTLNRNYVDLLGIDPVEATGRPVREVIPFTMLPQVLEKGKPCFSLGVYGGQDLLVSEYPVLGEHCRVVGAVGKAITQAEALNMHLEDFIEGFRLLEGKLHFYREELKQLYSSRNLFDRIIGESPPMRTLKKMMERVARGDANILLTGESGTGKELVAEAIHRAGPRGGEPLIKINCTAIPENLLEAELFGYEEGAFTGAVRGGKPGKFELANGGTIFLDEIGDMPLSMQPKLLRVIQERCFERVGGRKTIKVDVRIISATNQELEKLVEEGRFRLDLYYRLAVITLSIPPLRQRREDIHLLATAVLEQLQNRYGPIVKGISPGVLEAFTAYSWPGNVRELENVLEHAFNFVEPGEEVIEMRHLPPRFREGASRREGRELKDIVEQAEEAAVREALIAAEGNKQEAARLLGIHPSGLYQKLKKYGITEKGGRG
ncbi:hypothetical protein SY88_14255 [Clostridiales bacterium PH28_bin88]|nr:hypothetical protein SY88_14255 [Clostridiales bacterium PH28_bin88]